MARTSVPRTSIRSRASYSCAQCGAEAPRWLGQCPRCSAWGTLVEQVVPASGVRSAGTPASAPIPVPLVDPLQTDHLATGLAELDGVLGGGLVPGSVTVLGGEPGIGKSTLALQAVAGLVERGGRALVVTGEESLPQVRARAERLGALSSEILLVAQTGLADLCAHIEAARPDLVVVDSIQTLVHPDVGGAPGSVGQVRECASELVRLAKRDAVAMILVGHVTKEGTLAGPRALEHVVDTVLAFEGDRHHALRILRAHKHRFGPTDGLGLFEMTDRGLAEVTDASAMLLADRQVGAPGSVVACVLEEGRPMLVEVQALVAGSTASFPRRSAQGFDAARLGMLLAVLEERFGLPVSSSDVYVSVAGGLRAVEPALDLGIVVAVASAVHARPVPDGVTLVGEVGLGGEVRQVGAFERRCHEAARMGHHTVVAPRTSAEVVAPRCVRVADVAEALRAVGIPLRATGDSDPT